MKDKKIGIAHVPSMKTSRNIKKWLSQNDKCFVKANYNNNFDKWEPLNYSEKESESVSSLYQSIFQTIITH